jgi:hypothetical protein
MNHGRSHRGADRGPLCTHAGAPGWTMTEAAVLSLQGATSGPAVLQRGKMYGTHTQMRVCASMLCTRSLLPLLVVSVRR